MIRCLNKYGTSDFPYHYTAKEVEELITVDCNGYQELAVNPNAWDDYISFAFVRNPFDFLVSLYYWVSQNPFHDMSDYFKSLSFSEYIRVIDDPTLQPTKFLHGDAEIYRRPLSTFILNDDGEIMVDFVGKLENVKKDFQTVCDMIGIPNELSEHKANATAIRPIDYRDSYTKESRAIVERLFQRDLEMFGYEF